MFQRHEGIYECILVKHINKKTKISAFVEIILREQSADDKLRQTGGS